VQPLPRLFLHYFDIHFLEVAARRSDAQQVFDELRLATRIAVLVGAEVLVPAASYFESHYCAEILDELADLYPSGAIQIVGGDNNVDDFILAKLAAYDEGGDQHARYLTFQRGDEKFPPFHRRVRSATLDIRRAWTDRAQTPTFLEDRFGGDATALPKGFLDQWQNVPDLLGSRAFTPAYASLHLASGSMAGAIKSVVNSFVNSEYFRSYSDEYGSGFVTDLVVLGAAYDLDDRHGNLSYRRAVSDLRRARLLETVRDASGGDLLDLRDKPEVMAALLPAVTSSSTASQSQTRAKLTIVTKDQSHALAAMRATATGQRDAGAYQRRVADILDNTLSHSLGRGNIELAINEGRKRIDLAWTNYAEEGVFRWLAQHHFIHASMVYAECKNYKDDLANREFDQLIARFDERVTKFGFLLCRKVKDRPQILKRSRDAFHMGQGVVVVLDDDDVSALASSQWDASWKGAQSIMLAERVQEVIL